MRRSQALQAELHTTWNRKLYIWYQYYNDQYTAGVLKTPLLAIDRSTIRFGQWNSSRRTISIAISHIERDSWLAVMDTLRHEMAHQYVDEVLFEAGGQRPHGPAFRKACERLRCSAAASALPGDADVAEDHTPTQDDRVLVRLKKVLSLASSPNEHEAEAAVKKARRLLLQYNIDVVELDRRRAYSSRTLGPVKARRASWELWLAMILNEFFFVEVLWGLSYDADRDRDGTVLQIFGTDANLDMSEYVYDYFSNLLGALWVSYRASEGLPDNRERQRYFAGVTQGFYGKLQEQERSLGQETALVWKGDTQLRDYYRYVNPQVHTRTCSGVSASAAFKDGLVEGRRLTIRQPLETGGGFGGYLK
jgi:hypothetical protein